MKKTPPLSPATRLISAGINQDQAHGAIMPPIYLSTNFSFEGLGKKRTFDYARSGQPNRETLADLIADLEGGAGAVISSSGLAALDLLWQDLGKKARVVVPHDCYGGTQRLLNARHDQGLIECVYCDLHDDAAVESALKGAKLLLIETPSNPLMRLYDLADLTKKAHAAGAKVAVDNTFLSPALQRPLEFGADFVVHSTTKYINGHSDVIGGALVCREAEDVVKKRWWANCVGATATAFDCYLTFRGVKTLFVRVAQQQQSAQKIAEFLESHPKIARVFYPGLKSHPQYALACTQQKGFGAMLSFELKGGIEAVSKLFEAISLFSIAESLGGVESLIVHPSSMTHAAMSEEAQARAGITQGLVRLSIGLEEAEDLIAALECALSNETLL